MPLSEPNLETGRPDDLYGEPVDAVDLFEQMLEAEIMGNGTYGADPALDLIEERLSQLRQGPEPQAAAVEPPAAEIEPPAVVEMVEEIAPQRSVAAAAVPPTPTPAAVRPAAPAVVVIGNRPAALPKVAASADSVVLEASRAAGVAPTYRQPAAPTGAQSAPAPRRHRKRSSLPTFYLAVLALLLVSFALFAVWRPVYDEVIDLRAELAENAAEVAPTVPALPVLAAKVEAPVDPQVTASVSAIPAAATGPEFPAATSRDGYTARRIVKLYRVDAQGNIIGLPPSP
jgi:hypothetical protein